MGVKSVSRVILSPGPLRDGTKNLIPAQATGQLFYL
jgi:hypothetical protein